MKIMKMIKKKLKFYKLYNKPINKKKNIKNKKIN